MKYVILEPRQDDGPVPEIHVFHREGLRQTFIYRHMTTRGTAATVAATVAACKRLIKRRPDTRMILHGDFTNTLRPAWAPADVVTVDQVD